MAGDVRRWPLVLIAAPAAVAVWSGWVGLGGLCGFGVIHPLPGIVPGFKLNTAITLPVGVEAYGAYALGAWLAPVTSHDGDESGGDSSKTNLARKFAKRSALGALALGMLGQVVFHLLAAAHATRAPWPVVVLVSCMPVVTLGFGAALTHLLRAPAKAEIRRASADLGTVPDPSNQYHGTDLPLPAGAEPFAAELAAGQVPSIRRIRRELHVGQPKAQQVQRDLFAYLDPSGGASAFPRAPGPPPEVNPASQNGRSPG